MFDFSFWEIALVAAIALVVLGPERLPVVARTLGRWVAQARQYMNALTAELENEIDAEDLRRDVREARERVEAETREFRSSTERDTAPLMTSLKSDVDELRASVVDHHPPSEKESTGDHDAEAAEHDNGKRP